METKLRVSATNASLKKTRSSLSTLMFAFIPFLYAIVYSCPLGICTVYSSSVSDVIICRNPSCSKESKRRRKGDLLRPAFLRYARTLTIL